MSNSRESQRKGGMSRRKFCSPYFGNLSLFRESLELMTSRPYVLQLVLLASAMLRVRRFYKRHLNNFARTEDLLQLIPRDNGPTFTEICQEYQEVERGIRRSQMRRGLTRRMDFALTQDEGLVLYLIVRARRPRTVLETGVANGFSTRIILEALKRNGCGSLVSTEISENVGTLVGDPLKKIWHLKVGRPREVLIEALEQMDSIDVFLHDSDHRYENVLFELRSVYQKMSHPGVIVSDDVEMTSAFFDFAISVGARPIFSGSFRKVLGIIQV